MTRNLPHDITNIIFIIFQHFQYAQYIATKVKHIFWDEMKSKQMKKALRETQTLYARWL